MSDLKPCPFCGTQPNLPDGDGTQYEIWCEDCGGAVASVQICDLMTLEERASDSFKDYRYGEEFVDRAKLEAIGKWNTRAPAEDVRAVAPAIDFNEEILLPCPPGVRVGLCGDVKLSFDGAEYRGRAWLMEQGGKEEWVAIEGPENARKAGEALIKWAEAWEGQGDEDRS